MKKKIFYSSFILSLIAILMLVISLPLEVKGNNNSYIKVLNDSTPVLISENGNLVPKAYLVKDEIYSFTRGYGTNWVEIELGGKIGYVFKGAVETSTTKPPKLLKNPTYTLSGEIISTTSVYDNSKGHLTNIGVIETGQQIKILRDYGNWYRISFLNREAYIAKSDVKLTFSQHDQFFRAEDTIEIKERVNGSLVTKGVLNKGKVFERIGEYGPNWHKIEFAGGEAYIYKKNTSPVSGRIKNKSINVAKSNNTITFNNDATVYDNSTGKLIPIAEVYKGTEYAIAKDYGKWWGINISGYLGYVNKSEVSLNIKDSDYFQVINSNVAININEKGKLRPVGEASKGQIYKKVRDYGPNWYEIEFGTKKAYIYKANTTPVISKITNKSINVARSNNTITFNNDATVYDNSTGKLIPIAEVYKGTEYAIAKDYGKWWGINISGYLGYVNKSEVSLNIKDSDYFQVINSNVAININEKGKLRPVGEASKGQIYKKVRDYGPNWYEIEFGTKKAYIYKANTTPVISKITNKSINVARSNNTITFNNDATVYDNSTGKLIPIAEVYKGTEYAIAKDYGKWWGINISGYLGYVNKSEVRLNLKTSDYFQVLNSSTAININENGILQKVGELTKGQVYKKIRDYGTNWYEIQFGNQKGYVYKPGTTLVRPNLYNGQAFYGNNGSKLVKIINTTVVFDNQNGELTPIGKINKGTEYPILSDYGKWYRIVYSNRIGYIHKSGVRDLFNETNKTFQMLGDAAVFQNRNGRLVQVGELKKDQYFEREKAYGNWHQLKFGNETAFVWKDATQPATYTPTRKLTNNELRTIRKSAVYEDRSNRKVSMVLEPGIDIPLKKTLDSNWYVITMFGRDLYINAKNVTEKRAQFIESHENIELIKQHLLQGPLVRNNPNTSINETVEAANLILTGKINFPDYGIIDISGGVNWKSGGKAIRQQHQNSYLRQLHGFFFINDLVEAYNLTGNQEYIDKGYEIIKDWQDKNPRYSPAHRMAWHDEGTARRLNGLINYYHSAQNILSRNELTNLYDMMTAHAILLLDEEFYSENTNHGMFQDQALIAFSKYFYEDSKFDFMYETAVSRLDSYYDSLISDDFVHLEHSPSYHQVIASSLRRFSNVLSSFNDMESANKFHDMYLKMVDYGINVIKPDGKWPLIGDTYGFSNPPNRNMWSDSRYQYAVTQGLLGDMPTSVNAVYPSAGYAIFRNSWDIDESETYLFFTAAYHTSYHKHSDDLSFWLYHKKDLIAEAGPFSYQLSDPTTAYAYSSFGHNTLIVNDEGLPRVDGKYNQTGITNFNIDNESHPYVTGINNRFEDVTHSRTLAYNKNNNIVTVQDDIESSNENNYKLLWHLAPNITPEIDEDTGTIYLQDDESNLAEMHFNSDSSLKIDIHYGESDEKYKGLHFAKKSDMQEVEIIETYVVVLEFESDTTKVKTDIILK